MLSSLGITSCAHLGQQMALLSLMFSETAWHHFMRISLGLGSTHMERWHALQLISAFITTPNSCTKCIRSSGHTSVASTQSHRLCLWHRVYATEHRNACIRWLDTFRNRHLLTFAKFLTKHFVWCFGEPGYRDGERKSMSTERYISQNNNKRTRSHGSNTLLIMHFVSLSVSQCTLYPRHPVWRRTFREMSVAEEQLSLCRELCEDLAADLKKEGLRVGNDSHVTRDITRIRMASGLHSELFKGKLLCLTFEDQLDMQNQFNCITIN